MRILHHLYCKLAFWRHKNINKIFKKYVLPLAIITIVWEIIEDIGFPILFYFLGKHVHPSFYVGMPVSWLLCIHPIAIPLIFSVYCFIVNKKQC